MNRASLPVHLRPIATRRLGIVAVCLSLAIATGCSSSSHPDGTHSGANESNASNESSRPDDGFDVRAENAKPGTRAWQIGADEQADDTQLAGFVDHDSIAPGTKLTLKATTQASRFDITAYRMGWYGGAQGREVAKRTNIAAISQPKPQVKAGNEVDASNWKPNATLDTAGWAPGLYLLKLTADVGGKPKAKWIPLVVRSTSLKGKLGIVYATPTYQAYNEWGGWSLYHGPNGSRATHVSFDRPYDRSGARLVTASTPPADPPKDTTMTNLPTPPAPIHASAPQPTSLGAITFAAPNRTIRSFIGSIETFSDGRVSSYSFSPRTGVATPPTLE